MPKKELPTTIRQMHGYEQRAPQMAAYRQKVVSDMADQILAGTPHLKKLADDLAKDKLIAELRASIAELEALKHKDAARRAKQRDRTAKVRAKK